MMKAGEEEGVGVIDDMWDLFAESNGGDSNLININYNYFTAFMSICNRILYSFQLLNRNSLF
jgi:hypothetical protein